MKGDRNDCKHYIGIDLPNVMYKTYARIVNKRIKVLWVDQNELKT